MAAGKHDDLIKAVEELSTVLGQAWKQFSNDYPQAALRVKWFGLGVCATVLVVWAHRSIFSA